MELRAIFYKENGVMLKWQPKVVSLTSLQVFYKQPTTHILITISIHEIKREQK